MKLLIVANWKMNPSSLAEANRLFGLVEKGSKKIKKAEVVVCPPFPYLLSMKYQASSIKLGAQDCFWEEKGAFTGEVSPLMLKNLRCNYVIIGHSERRNYFGETDGVINKKIKSALQAKLSPIFCIGETWQERNKGKTRQVLKSQIEKGLSGIKENEVNGLILAYEPVWAIGNGKICSFKEAQVMGFYSREIIARLFSSLLAKKIPVLYGGSVNSKNARDYVREGGFDGLLVGGASLNDQEFIEILRSVVNA
ncbi:MAG: triose-phosphate isomerase [Patescibacteria group bacterium]